MAKKKRPTFEEATANLERALIFPPVSDGIDDLWPYLNSNGHTYPLQLDTSMPGSKVEEIGNAYDSLVAAGFQSNSIIFGLEMKRIQVFSQARFMWQALRKGQPDNLYGTPALDILAHPWPGGTTGDLLTKMLTHADFGGNSFVARRANGQLRCLRPNWVDMLLGSFDDPDLTSDDIDAEFLAIVYWPGGKQSGRTPEIIERSQLAHFAPIPDPRATYRGMSWITPIVRELMGDKAATTHKLKFFENAGTPNLVVKRSEPLGEESFNTWVAMMEEGHKGLANAYRTLYLTAGADAHVVGADMRQLDFKIVQGAGETRMATAAGVHPAIAALSEGMQGASLNAGNFNSARRSMADTTMWHLWSNLAGSLEPIVDVPPGSRLWIDPRDIPFLREDRKDQAEIQQIKAASMRQLTDGGWQPDAVVEAVEAEDYSLLKGKHSKLFSVQLQPPGTVAETAPVETTPPTPTNGTGKAVPAEA